jgi:hypothetical protein
MCMYARARKQQQQRRVSTGASLVVVLRAEVSVQPELVRVIRHAVPDYSVRLGSLVRDRDAALDG